MAGFLTHYLFGMESCDILSDNYIREVIKNNNHAFLLGLQGNNLLSFNPHTLSKRGLSYRTASMTMRNQEYAHFLIICWTLKAAWVIRNVISASHIWQAIFAFLPLTSLLPLTSFSESGRIFRPNQHLHV